MYNHINDCWADIKEAKTIEEVKNLFRKFPRWSGDWDVEIEDFDGEKRYIVTNTYWDGDELQYDDREIEIPVEKHTILDSAELNKRANEVFILERDEIIYDVIVEGDNVKIPMSEVADDGERVEGNYLPDMSDRPEALDYLMGKRDDFND